MKVLELATIDSAKVLGMDKEIGSLELGKKLGKGFFDLHFYSPLQD